MKYALAFSLVLLTIASSTFANHGPGTSGGGSSTISGETMKAGQFSLDARMDYTEFDHISTAEAQRRAVKSGGLDALRAAHVYTGTLSYGLLDDLQLSATLGYYKGTGFTDAERSEDDPTEAESGHADPEGLTDLWINAKWRLLKGKPGNLSLVGGVKFPVGRDDVKLNNGETLEASSQPGTGAYDYQIGLAYSRFLTSHLTMDASALYTFRTRHDGFKVGDRFDAGLAVAYRLTESIKQFWQWSVFAEANYIWIGKDHGNESGLNNNSGGNTLYLTPGVRVRFNENMSLTVAPSFPVWQDLQGDQIESQFKLAVTFSYSF